CTHTDSYGLPSNESCRGAPDRADFLHGAGNRAAAWQPSCLATAPPAFVPTPATVRPFPAPASASCLLLVRHSGSEPAAVGRGLSPDRAVTSAMIAPSRRS